MGIFFKDNYFRCPICQCEYFEKITICRYINEEDSLSVDYKTTALKCSNCGHMENKIKRIINDNTEV